MFTFEERVVAFCLVEYSVTAGGGSVTVGRRKKGGGPFQNDLIAGGENSRSLSYAVTRNIKIGYTLTAYIGGNE